MKISLMTLIDFRDIFDKFVTQIAKLEMEI